MNINRLPISVCMTTYNSERFLSIQIDSILKQLLDSDELIIVDDASRDSTLEILSLYNDPRIRIYQNNQNLREIKSFEKAIFLASNEFIFLADHDDEWTTNRLEVMMKEFTADKKVVFGNINNFSMSKDIIVSKSVKLEKSDEDLTIRNLIKILTGRNGYYGCALAFKKEIRDEILPFPKHVESHDLYIALYGVLNKTICHCEEVVINRRITLNNISLKYRSLILKIKSRFYLILNVIKILLIKVKK